MTKKDKVDDINGLIGDKTASCPSQMADVFNLLSDVKALRLANKELEIENEKLSKELNERKSVAYPFNIKQLEYEKEICKTVFDRDIDRMYNLMSTMTSQSADYAIENFKRQYKEKFEKLNEYELVCGERDNLIKAIELLRNEYEALKKKFKKRFWPF